MYSFTWFLLTHALPSKGIWVKQPPLMRPNNPETHDIAAGSKCGRESHMQHEIEAEVLQKSASVLFRVAW